jgi:tRNA (cmo5U34)-methyltransferase
MYQYANMTSKRIRDSGYIQFRKSDVRYSPKMLSHYDILKIAIPHYDLIQDNLALAVKNMTKGKTIHILDMGCGTGLTSLAILKRVKNVHITAVDSEKVMVEQATDRLKNYIKQGKIRIVQAEGLQFMKKLKQESFDVFATALTLHNFKKILRKQFIKEAHRILKNKGLFVNADKYASDNVCRHRNDLQFQLACFNKFDRLHLPAIKKEWVGHYLNDMKKDRIMRINESFQELRKLGFTHPSQIFRRHMFGVVTAVKINTMQ